MIRQAFQNRWQQLLSPGGKWMGCGNTTAYLINLVTNAETNLGPYCPSGWPHPEILGVRDFVPGEALRYVSIHSGDVLDRFPAMDAALAQIKSTWDGARWGWDERTGIFSRNDVEVLKNVSGNLSGQVLSEDGAFFSAERMDNAWRTSVYDRLGAERFSIDRQAVWAHTFNFGGAPCLFHTFDRRAHIDMPNGAGGFARQTVAQIDLQAALEDPDAQDNRGALIDVGGSLWAATYTFIHGKPYAFLRPWNDERGIRLQMPGGLMQGRFDASAQTFTLAGHNQETGELVTWREVPLDTPRKLITETPDYDDGGGDTGNGGNGGDTGNPPAEDYTHMITMEPGETLLVKCVKERSFGPMLIRRRK